MYGHPNTGPSPHLILYTLQALTQASHPPSSHLTLAQTLYLTYINSTSITQVSHLNPLAYLYQLYKQVSHTSLNPLPHLYQLYKHNTGFSTQPFTLPISTLQAGLSPHLTLAQTLYLTYINSTIINTAHPLTSPNTALIPLIRPHLALS